LGFLLLRMRTRINAPHAQQAPVAGACAWRDGLRLNELFIEVPGVQSCACGCAQHTAVYTELYDVLMSHICGMS